MLSAEVQFSSSLKNYVLGFFAICFVLPAYLLLVSGFPLFDAIKVVSVVSIQLASGAVIWHQLMHPKQVPVVESVGMGLALGMIFGVVGHQLFLSSPLHSFGWLLPVPVALVVLLFYRKDPVTRTSLTEVDLASLFFVVLAVVVILTQWWWLLPLAVPSGLALFLLSTKGQQIFNDKIRRVWLVTCVLFVAATLLMIYLRQLNLDWWIRSWDVTMFETKSYSIAKYGPSANLSLAGYPMNYHWFAIAWLGSLTVVCNLAPWLSIAQIAPVYSVIGIGCVVWAISKRTSLSPATKYVILVLFAFATSAYSPANPPNIISLIWVLAGFVVADEFFSRYQTKMFVAFGVIAISAFSGKVSAGFSLLGAFVLTDLWLAFKKNKNIAGTVVRTLLLATATVSAFYLVIGGPNRLGNNTFRVGFLWLSGLYGVDGDRNIVIQIAGWSGSMLLILPFAIIAFSSTNFKSQIRPLAIFSLAGFIAGLVPCFFLNDDGMVYFLVTTRVFAALGFGIAFSTMATIDNLRRLKYRKILLTFSLSIFVGFLYMRLMALNWREIGQIRGGPTLVLLAITLSYFLIVSTISLIALVKFTNENIAVTTKQAINLVCLLLLINGISYATISRLQSVPHSVQSKVFAPDYIGSREMKQAAIWLTEKTDALGILATNKFCVEANLRICIDPKLFVVSSMTRMQLFIEGPSRSVGIGGDDETLYPIWAKERLDLSRGFADKPTAEITAKLREFGVDWFYLFLENTTNRNWEPYGTIAYRNSEVAIIKLNSP